MLDRLRARQTNVGQIPPRPAKIRPNVSINDFRKSQPKIIKVQNHNTPTPTPRLEAKPVQYTTKPQLLPKRQQVPQPVQSSPIPRSAPVEKKVYTPPKLRQPAHAPSRPVSSPGGQPKVIRTSYPVKTSSASSISSLRNIGRGRVLVMIAAGPSINEIDFKPLKNQPLVDIMCINQPHAEMWPSKFWSFCDHSQYKRNMSYWDTYDGIIINSTNVRARRHNQHIVENIRTKGFSHDISAGYHIGRSTTYASMQVASHFGYEKSFIFGCDMGEVNGAMHYYGQNPDVPNERRKERFAAEAESYLWAGKNLADHVKEKYVFCSNYNNWPFMELFPRMDHTKAVQGVIDFANTLQK